MNQLVNKTLDLMQGMVSLPFEAAQNVWDNQETSTGRLMHQSVRLAEDLAVMPFNIARDFFKAETTDAKQTEGTQNNEES